MRPKRWQRICETLLTAALFLFPLEAAKAQTIIHVPLDQPTIQAAINTAANGNTVLVAPGTYKENINFMGKAIAVTSSGGAQVTIIDGGGTGPVVTFSTGEGLISVLSGFTIQNGFANFDGGGILISGASPTITNNIIFNNSSCSGGGIAVEFGSPLIKANIVSNNFQAGCGGGTDGGGILIQGLGSAQIVGNVIDHNVIGFQGGGIGMFVAGTPTIRSNIIVGNTASNSGGGIGMVNQSDANIIQNLIIGNSSPQGGGLYWSVPSSDRGPLLVNNTIAGNDSADGSGIFGDGFQSQTTMVNNIIVAKSGEIAVFCGNSNNLTPPIFNFDDVFSTGTTYAGICTDQTGINGNISADPLFVDPASSNYHLRVGSPAIDVGDNSAPNLPPKDIDGDKRIIDATGKGTAIVDMGVDEFSSAQILTLSSASLNFGLQAVGTSAVQSLIFTNNGAAAANISAVMAGGDFSQTNTCGTSLAAGANCTVSVTFAPTVRGLQNGVAAIMTDASESPQAVLLSGTGAAPVVNLSSASLSFSGQAINTTSPAKTVTLTNTGDSALTFTSIVPSGDFGLISTGMACSTSTPVGPGASCTLNVTFTPSATGARAGSVTITDNASGSPQTIQLSGQGLAGPPATIAATSGTPQTATINKAFMTPLQATVKDAVGNAVSGVTVTFTAPARNATATFTGGVNTAVTNGRGVATSAPFTANSIAGGYTVTARAGAVGPANFDLTNTATAPATITATGGTPQSAVINTAFASPLQADVRDASGNAASGVTVTFTAPGSGASGTFAGGVNTAVANASGMATSAVFTANNLAGGPYRVTASVAGVTTPASFSLANTATAPATITATGGTAQSATVNTAFATPLQAIVKDAGGNAVSGVTVTFTAPASKASGTFMGGLKVNTAVTNASGVAASVAFTADSVVGGPYAVTASVAGVATPASFSLTNTVGAPATITATGGTPQSAVINTAFASPLQAEVRDASGSAASGVTVTFTAPGSGASGTFAGGVNTAVTNASGMATSAVFTANNLAGGPYRVTASVAGVTTPASFSLANTATAPATITATGGTAQSATVNTAFATPLQVIVKDAGGNAVSGVTVTFTAPASKASGTFMGGLKVNTAVTNASGVAASVAFTADSVVGGPYAVTASVAGVATPASFSLTNTVGAPATITATGGTPQSAVINTAFASPLQAEVRDAGGNAASGVTVTFTAPGSGASGTFAGGVNTAVTNASGMATSAVFTANNLAGGPYRVTASVAGVTTPASFSLANTATAPATITATGGTAQSATVNTAFATPLQAIVKDAGGNAVSGVTVTFTAPAGKASGTFMGGLKVNTAVTNVSGVATSAAFTASGIVGSYSVMATVGVVGPANFNLTNTAAPPAFSPAMNFGTGGITPIYVQAADVNLDGKLDLVVVNQNSDTVGVLLGNGDGTFQPPATYDIASGGQSLPGCAAVADFNNDGRPDIAVTNGLIGTSGGTISILLNKGDGTFLPAVKVNSNTSPICLTSADLNADGNQDLWVGGNGSSAVLLGKGDGTFQTPQIYQIGLGDTQGVAVGDLNGDGLPDLLGVALTGGGPPSQPPSSVGVLLNQGNANFGPSPFGTVTLYPVGSLGAAIVLGDFNHDGNLDAAVTNFGTNDISILLGNGDGTFKPQSRFLAGSGPFSLASADFDGTGRIDLVVTTQNAALNGNGVRVFLGNGDGTFKFYQGLATGSSPAYVTVGDFNGDGVPDIAVVDSATNVVSIILTQ